MMAGLLRLSRYRCPRRIILRSSAVIAPGDAGELGIGTTLRAGILDEFMLNSYDAIRITGIYCREEIDAFHRDFSGGAKNIEPQHGGNIA